jgi:amidase
MSSGWSAVRGQNVNPYVLNRNPCGSSSGSAVAVAAHLATVAVGTETWGSILCPAGVTGVVGIKPTVGLVSRAGVVPISAKVDTAGPFARSVRDATIVLATMQGPDPRDPVTAESAPFVGRSYAAALRAGALRGARIGVWRNASSPQLAGVYARAVRTLRRAGATVVPVRFNEQPLIDPAFRALQVEFKHDLNAYLAGLPGTHPRTLLELIVFNRRHARQEQLRRFNQELFRMSQATRGGLATRRYRADRRTATEGARRRIDTTLTRHNLAAIMALTNGPGWLTEGETTTCAEGADASTLPALAGYPSVTVPAGMVCDRALPIGVTFFAGRWSEPSLFGVAHAYERASRERRPPRYLPTLP